MEAEIETSNFDLKRNHIPQDITSVKVVYKGGFYERFKNNSTEKLSTTPLPIRPTPKDCQDFTGYKKANLKVIGLYAGPEVGIRPKGKNRTKPRGHGWVCVCKCGNYTTRKTSSIKKHGFDACIECRSLRYYRDIKGKTVSV